MPPRTTIHVPPLSQQERDLLKILSAEEKRDALIAAAQRKANETKQPARPAKG